jgi:hypothetical protein
MEYGKKWEEVMEEIKECDMNNVEDEKCEV